MYTHCKRQEERRKNLGMGTTLSVRLRFCEPERTELTEPVLKTDLKPRSRAGSIILASITNVGLDYPNESRQIPKRKFYFRKETEIIGYTCRQKWKSNRRSQAFEAEVPL